MTSRIKVISIAAFAVAAMSMIGLTSAQAAVSELHATNTPGKAVIVGEQVTQKFADAHKLGRQPHLSAGAV